MSMLDEVSEFVMDELEENFAEDDQATYTTDEGSALVTLTLGQTLIDTEEEGQVIVTGSTIDVLIRRTELEIAGSYFLPEPGHQITLAGGEVLEVLEFGGSGEHFRFSDPKGVRLRIHCKLVKGADPTIS